jgi:hypothetical protein
METKLQDWDQWQAIIKEAKVEESRGVGGGDINICFYYAYYT